MVSLRFASSMSTSTTSNGADGKGRTKELKELSRLALTNKLGPRLNIAGIDQELSSLFRRVFASRLTPPELAQSIGLRHVKGVLLYGPPGTGKTLVARKIAQVLTTRRPKVVNGPEIFNHLLGSSEQRIRELFKPAEEEWKRQKEKSAMHVIIIDEIDAVCRRRGGGSSADSASHAHRDAVVNQFLTKIDGLEQQHNILVIGTTNRLDILDEAVLRPGRLELIYVLDFLMPQGESKF